MPIDFGISMYKRELTTDQAELVLVREPLKFQDILLANYNYQFISDNLRKYNKKQENNG